jgi:integrase
MAFGVASVISDQMLTSLQSGLVAIDARKRQEMRRKRFQRGSLTTRKRNGKKYWLAQWREKGGHKTKELGLCSKIRKIAAESMLQEILKPINEGSDQKITAQTTFGQFVEHVYIAVYRRKWKDSTADTEISQIRYHLVRTLGDDLLRDITREILQNFLDRTAKTCGRSVVDHLRFRLRSIFQLAMAEGLVDRNPAAALFRPRQIQPSRERRVMVPSDSSAMLQVLNLREQVIVRLATWEGMRPGEILALRVGDVDLEEECLWVRRRVYRGKLGDPKNDRSKRQVALTVGTKLLVQMWLEQACARNPAAWLFPSENGKPLRRDNVWTRYIMPRLKQIGLEWATFQVMRRSYATWSRRVGVDAHTRSAQMGNTVDVNENEYAVATFEQKLAAVRLLETAVVQ